MRLDAGQCSGCGHPLAITSDLSRMREWDIEEITCHACELLEGKAKNDGKDGPGKGVKRFIARILGVTGD